jgi:phage terminase large subunit
MPKYETTVVNAGGTRVFYENMAARNKVLINRGGARSSKSYSIAQKHTNLFIGGKKRKILIVRKTSPSLRVSVYALMKYLWMDWGIWKDIHEEKRDLNYYLNGNWIHFTSVDDIEKIKSSEWNNIWVEEATEFSYEEFIQFTLRLSSPIYDDFPNQITLSFNPIDAYHWIKTKLIEGGEEDFVEIVSTYRDNPYLSLDYIKILKDLKKTDKQFWRVYAKGLWGRLENMIYANYVVKSEKDFPTSFDEITYGLDFGYVHPTVLLEVAWKEKVPYVRELIYQSGLTNEMLMRKMDKLKVNKNAYMWADTAESIKIEELQREGYNVMQNDKAVLEGIDMCKRFPIVIATESTNTVKEAQTYSWKKDRRGIILEEPVKFKDDAMDAMRYAIFNYNKMSHFAPAFAGDDAVPFLTPKGGIIIPKNQQQILEKIRNAKGR